jgi:hypothetical protein
LDEIQTKVLRVFLLAIHSRLYSFYFFKLTQPLTVSRVQFLYIVKEKGGKPDRKPYPLPYGLRNPYRNLKSENSQDYAQKPQRNCTFMNSASGLQQQNSPGPQEELNERNIWICAAGQLTVHRAPPLSCRGNSPIKRDNVGTSSYTSLIVSTK